MGDISAALEQLEDLCVSIHDCIAHTQPAALYRAPIIDWHHPDDYAQKGITGLRKFLGTAEAERDHVAGLAKSPIPPKEFSSNAPHLLAVWHEFVRSAWPLGAISQSLDVGAKVPVKVDIIARGGAEWVKVNTIKETRLLAEFREQDSYKNSDYDSDTSSPGVGPSRLPDPTLINSLIVQGETLLRAAEAYPRPSGRPAPRVRLVLNRLIRPIHGFSDGRIDRTIAHLGSLGIVVQLGPTCGLPLPSSPRAHLRPSKNIVLDLSVLVALCCDSTHYPLPSTPDEFESRFRSLRIDEVTGEPVLSEHSHTSKDLRDQLQWEAQHPLIQELKDRLGAVSDGDEGRELAFWITEEVRGRLPALVDVIGGPEERKRGKALLDPEEGNFWRGSRWEGNEGVLKALRVQILPDDPAAPEAPVSIFQRTLVSTCQALVVALETPITPDAPPATRTPRPQRRSRHPARPATMFPTNRYPSGHTLRTLIAGAERGWTVLSNNRGAIGKVGREMGISEGLCWSASQLESEGQRQGDAGRHDQAGESREERDDELAALWVVNPSSLSEWRRLEVVNDNMAVQCVPR